MTQRVRLTNGQHWTSNEFVDHYFKPTASGTPTPVAGRPAPVDVDMSWYMDEGPGRYYHPGMFPIVNRLLGERKLPPGLYDLLDFVPNKNEKDPSLKARLSNYVTDIGSADYLLRSLVFGSESAKISGRVEVHPDGSKTFNQIEIRPFDTNFDFDANTLNGPLEVARAVARRLHDPDNLGTSYDVNFRSPWPGRPTGRIYDPFTDSQLSAGLARRSMYLGSKLPGLLPSTTGKAPLPYAGEHLQYVSQVNGIDPQPSTLAVGGPVTRVLPLANHNLPGNETTSWMASVGERSAGPAPQREDRLRGVWSGQPMEEWFVHPSVRFPF